MEHANITSQRQATPETEIVKTDHLHEEARESSRARRKGPMATTNGLHLGSSPESAENERTSPVRDLRRGTGLQSIPRHGYGFAGHGRDETSVGDGPDLYTSFAEELVTASRIAPEEPASFIP